MSIKLNQHCDDCPLKFSVNAYGVLRVATKWRDNFKCCKLKRQLDAANKLRGGE